MRPPTPRGEGYPAGVLLERLMHERCLPARFRPVSDPAELPIRLQQIVCVIGLDGVWRAYTDDTQWWFAVSNAEQTDRGRWTLNVSFFSQDGVLCGAGSWRFASNTGFVLTRIFDIGSTCDRTTAQLEHAVWH